MAASRIVDYASGVLWALLLVAALVGCNRSETRTGGRAAERDHITGPTAAEARATTVRRGSFQPAPHACIVRTPSPSPPAAPKAARCPPDPTGDYDLPRGSVTFEDAPGKPRVSVEIAREPKHRERGLMYRTSMGEDEGMLFSWADERPRSFWMHNTCIPLDMLFIARDGTVVGILEQVPTLNDASRAIPCPAAHVLELNAGWTRSHGVVAGQRAGIEAPRSRE